MLCMYLISKINIYNIVRYILCVDKDQNKTRNVTLTTKKSRLSNGTYMCYFRKLYLLEKYFNAYPLSAAITLCTYKIGLVAIFVLSLHRKI
jgi:hypothetical protein